MLRTRLVLAAWALGFVAGPAFAADHLVSREDVSSRLARAQNARASDLAAVQDVLAAPAAQEAASRLGADTARLRAAAATLDDAELRDLARRARAVRDQPAAGLSKDVNDLLVLFLIIAIVILVLQAVD